MDDPTSREQQKSNATLWRVAIYITVLGLGLRLMWFLTFPDGSVDGIIEWFYRLGPDGQTYLLQAEAYRNGFITDPAAGQLASIYREVFPPGYPLFLTAIMTPFSDLSVRASGDTMMITIRAVQWLLAAGTTLMTFALAKRVLIGWTALIPPTLLTVSIAWVDVPSLIAYETLLAFLLTAALLLLVKAGEQAEGTRDRRLLVLLAGVAFGFGLLVQPRIGIALPFIAIWAGRAMPRQLAAVFLVAALIAPAAWIARTYALYDEFVPISINGQASVYLDNVDPVGGTGFVRRAAPVQCPRSELISGNQFEWARCMQAEGYIEMLNHPLETAVAFPDRLAALISPWNPTHARGTYASTSWDYHKLIPDHTLQKSTFKTVDNLALIAWLAAYGMLIVVGIFTLWVEGAKSSARLIAIPLVTVPLVHLVYHAENRFRMPLMPFMMIALTLGLMAVWELRPRSR